MFKKSRFAGAISTNQANPFAGLNRQIGGIEQRLVAKAMVNIFCVNQVHEVFKFQDAILCGFYCQVAVYFYLQA